MGSAWWNLVLRFLLELSALTGFGAAGWRLAEGFWRWALTVLLPLAAALVWGLFAVPGDPSRSGNAPVPIPGATRLLLELTILMGGASAFWSAGHRTAGLAVATLVVVHYALSFDRIGWLLRQ